VVVELGGVKGGDVEGQDDDGGVSAGCAKAAELLDVGDVVAAAACGDPAAFPQVLEFGEPLDEGEREEEEDTETTEPCGGRDSCGGGSGDNADGVEKGENDDINQHGTLEAQGVGERGDEIDAEPEKEMERLDESELRRERGDDGRDEESERDGGEEEEDDDNDAGEDGEIS